MYSQKPSLAVLASAVIFSLSSQAALANVDETMVVTASGFEQAQIDAAASISVVTREDLEKRYYRDITDALRDVPGVTVSDGGDNTDISIRGMGSAYTLILVDGKRQNSRETRPNSDGPGIEHGFLPPLEAIERIEVIKGPMSTLYGSDAIGGVINVITRKVSNEWSGNVQVDALIQEDSDSGNQYGANFYLNGPLIKDQIGMQVYGQYVSREEDSILNGFEDKDLQSLTGKWTYQVDDVNTWILESGVNEQERSSSLGKTVDDIEDVEVNNYRRVHVGLTHQGTYDFGASDSYVQFERTDNDSRDIRIENTVLKSTWTMPFDSHFLTFGGEYEYEQLNDDGTNGNPNSDLTKIDNSSGALFIEDEWMITDSFFLTAGLRFDYDEEYDEHFSPRAYGVWHMTDEWTMKGGVSTGFKAPTLRQKTAGWAQTSNGGDIYGNPDLDPEESVNYELGVLYNNDFGISSGVTLFFSDFDDKIITTENCPDSICVNDTDRYRTNVDEAETKGVEVNFSSPITETVSMKSSYSYTDSEHKTGELKGKALTELPKHLANLSLDWQNTDALNSWTRVTYRGKESSSPSTKSSVVKAPDYTFVDVGLNYQLNKDTKLKAAVYNIFDEDVDYDEYGYVEDGRRYWIGMDVSF